MPKTSPTTITAITCSASTSASPWSIVTPDRIYIYRLPILDICDTHDDVVREVRTTLLHEIGHFLGMNEQDLDRLGYA